MNNTVAEINITNLKYNYKSIRTKTKTKVMAVVKADAYGHGMLECVKALKSMTNKPEYYGVAIFDEALQLRKSRLILEPILCFAPFEKILVNQYLKYNIIPSVTSPKQIKDILNINTKGKIKIHININTGMNRLGLHYINDFREIEKLHNKKNIIIDGIYTHFATSDEKDKSFAKLQLERFKSVITELKKQNIEYGNAHTANSGAILDMPDSYFDMVRPGISLYGYYPSLETSESIKLKPVMSIISKISTIKNISKSESVGYGRIFTANKKTFIGTIPIGYADGYLRGLSNKVNVIIKNKFHRQIGRVSMDRITVEINDSSINEGSKAILMGKSKNCSIDAWDWAKALDTIPYEITCSISKRIPRKFI